MHPNFYPGQGSMPPSPSQRMGNFRMVAGNPGQSSLVRPSYLQVDVNAMMNMQGARLPSPTQYPPPAFVVQRFPYSGQSSPANANNGIGLMPRPPPVYTGSNDTLVNDQTLRSLQERVAQIASIPRLSAQDLSHLNSQHITPRNVADDNRMLMQEVTHLNPPGGARVPFMGASKLHPSSSSASLSEFLQGRVTPSSALRLSHPGSPASASPPTLMASMPPPTVKNVSPKSSAAAAKYIGPTEEELRKLNELMPTGDDPDSKKSVEEWKRFRLRIMSRLRKQRWRAKKKAEVLAGVEDTKREEAERKRRDRLRKQEQRAKKKARMTDDTSSGQGADSSDNSSPQSSVVDSHNSKSENESSTGGGQ